MGDVLLGLWFVYCRLEKGSGIFLAHLDETW